MKIRNLKVKDKILVYILPFILVILLVISFLGYFLVKQIFVNNFNFQKKQVEIHVVNSIHLIDAGFAMLEKNLQPEMEKGVLELKNEFEKAGGDPEKISLDALKSEIGGKFDLMIIDSNSAVVKSTAPSARSFNFMDFDKSLGAKINQIRMADSIQYERIRTNVGTGYLNTFAYIPSDDHKYLLEIAYSLGSFGSIIGEMDPLTITAQLVKINPNVLSIRIFDAYGYEFVNNGSNYKPTAESFGIVDRVKKEKQFEVTDGNRLRTYLYIDLKDESHILSDNSKVVEIVYDNEAYLNPLMRISAVCFLLGLIIMAFMILALNTLSKRITLPITLLSSAAKDIAQGNYGIAAKKISHDEIGDLVDVFNAMTARIKEDFDKIEYQKAELENYNKNLEEMVDNRTIELVHARETIKNEKDILEKILDDTLSGYWDWDFENGRHYFSSGYKKMLGYDDYELDRPYETIKQSMYPDDIPKVVDCFCRHVESRGDIPFRSEVRYRHKDGSTIWVLFAGHVIEWNDEGRPLQMIGCQINITDMKALEKSLIEERELLKATLYSMGDGVISVDRNGLVEIMNPVAERLTGWSQQEANGRPFDELFQFLGSNPKEKFRHPLKKGLETGEPVAENQMILISRNGTEIPVEDSASPIRDVNGNITGAVLLFRDYTEKREKQARIEYLSLHDQLTGLYNRRYFEKELKRLDTLRNLPLTIIMLDVNGLKLINDAFGHAMGDLTLQRAAIIMKEECRGDDVIARFGGDEFVILMPRTGYEEAERLARRIYTAFETEIVDHISISVSCGWATKQDRSESLAAVFKLAEDHMYRRKLSESQSMHYKTIDTILKTLHGKSEREKKHSERVGELCESIAAALNLPPGDVKEFRTIGLMHDIGKIAIDLSILDKPGELNQLERAEIERHPELGYQILRSINDFAKLAEYVLSHHERWDGEGYPRRLKGEEIPLQSRIIAIADSYDSMTSDRAYRKAMGKDAAVEEIIRESGGQFDPYIVKIFVEKILGYNGDDNTVTASETASSFPSYRPV